MEVNVHQAKTHLSRLLQRVAAGEEIVISRAGTPIAKIVPLGPKPGRRQPGRLAGKMKVPRAFFAADAEIARHFNGDDE
jgi:prevent-host-death family protein